MHTNIPDIEQRNEAARLYAEYMRLDDIWTESETPESRDAVDRAWQAYERQPLRVDVGDNGKIVRCAITGVPILAGDKTVPVLALANLRVDFPDPPAGGMDLLWSGAEIVTTVEGGAA